MKKKMSLMERVKIAERREAEAKRQAERDRKRFMSNSFLYLNATKSYLNYFSANKFVADYCNSILFPYICNSNNNKPRN